MLDFIPIATRLPKFFERRPHRITYGKPFDDYTEIAAANASILKQPTPAHMWHSLAEDDAEESAALLLGRLVHTAVLEPNEFDSRTIILPADAPKKPTKAQRAAKKPKPETLRQIEWWDEFTEKAKGRDIITEEKRDQIEQMRDAVFNHHKARELITCPGHNEATIETWNDEMQVMQKARYDKLPGAGASFLVDLKCTCRELNDFAILSEVRTRGYHLQARYYLDVLNLSSNDLRRQFFFIFVRNEPPYLARLYELNTDLPGSNLLSDAKNLLYATDVPESARLPIGRLPMFINAAREFLQRVRESHPEPLAAWEGYEHEDARLLIPN